VISRLEVVDIQICMSAVGRHMARSIDSRYKLNLGSIIRVATRVAHKRVAWWQRLMSCYLHYGDDDCCHVGAIAYGPIIQPDHRQIPTTFLSHAARMPRARDPIGGVVHKGVSAAIGR